MGVSFTSHNTTLLRHLSPSPFWVSRSSFLSPYTRTLPRKVAFTQGKVCYSSTIVCHGEWILQTENDKARMVFKPTKTVNNQVSANNFGKHEPLIAASFSDGNLFTEGKVGYSTTTVCHGLQQSSNAGFNGASMVRENNKVENQVGETLNRQASAVQSAWRAEANRFRVLSGQMSSNSSTIPSEQPGSVVTLPSKNSEVERTKDVELKGAEKPKRTSRKSAVKVSSEESVGVTQSGPVETLPNKDSEVKKIREVKLKGDGKQKRRISAKSASKVSNEESVGVTQSGPVVTLPSQNMEAESNEDVDGKPRPLINGKSSVKESKDNTVTVSKVVKSAESLKVRENLKKVFEKVVVVDTVAAAKDVVAKLVNQYRNLVHACDTEVSQIDVKAETPVDHGEMICFSIYCGSEADFGNGKSCIWVDLLGENGREVLAEFKAYFEDSSIKKVWHNYSFDSHIIRNHGINLSGFHADTMHMARLWDSARMTLGGYSLETLTSDPKVLGAAQTKEEAEFLGKTSMKTIFGRGKLKKDGTEGKVITIPPVEELQREDREAWISYSALDAISTLKLYESMSKQLQMKQRHLDGKPIVGSTMLDFYSEFWRPFGELLVKMEAEGILVDKDYLAEIEIVAKAEQQVASNRFRNWASKYCPDAKYMNIGSEVQLRQLFFGGIYNSENHEMLPVEKLFKVPNIDNIIEEGKKAATKFRSIRLHRISDSPMSPEKFTASGWPSLSGDALKVLAGKVSAEYDFLEDDSNISLEEIAEDDDTDQVSKTQRSKRDAKTDRSGYGTAYDAFGGGERGKEACHAIASLCEVHAIDSLISNFILPLQGSNVSGKDGRVHCSLNINTETGRLSARRPNLQNQPALEKDRYKIRKAFVAAPGNTLIVADYGQLELRILAHLAGCKSMKEAFKAGGDFHSRTAMNMYPHIRKAVENGEVLLEWHPQPGEDKPPVPLLKDAFASERRKAKMLNFSIAYGKTAIGLAKDWKVSKEEAQDTVDLWYDDRPEVRRWQEIRKKEAMDYGFVRTLLGRARRFPLYQSRAHRNQVQRAAINTPVQGSAADVAMCAMLEISTNQRLKELGWKLLLQIHDEVILEGPMESAEIAKDIVVDCMSKPFNGKNILSVDLPADAKCAQNWYAAK